MSAYERILPFPRGETLEEGNTNLLGATSNDQLLGKKFLATDTVHGTGEDVVVMAVKNDSGSAITTEHRCVEFDSTALDLFRKVSGYCDSGGGLALPIDDAYADSTSLADHAIFYVVVKGPCYVKTEASAVSLGAGAAVTVDGSGYLEGAAPGANNFILGRLDAAATTTSTNVVVHVDTLVGGEGT
jgi:hypothetical protein